MKDNKYSKYADDSLLREFTNMIGKESKEAGPQLIGITTTHEPGGDEVFGKFIELFKGEALKQGATIEQVDDKIALYNEVRNRSKSPAFKALADKAFTEACVVKVGWELSAKKRADDPECSIL